MCNVIIALRWLKWGKYERKNLVKNKSDERL